MGKISAEKAIVFLLALSGVQSVLFPGPSVRVVIQLVIFIIICLLFIRQSGYLKSVNIDNKGLLVAYFCFGCWIVMHSVFLAKSYEQWRYLGTVFLSTLLLPIFSVQVASVKSFFRFFYSVLKFVFPFSFVFFAIYGEDKNAKLAFVYYAAYIYFFILFYSYCPKKIRLMVIVAFFYSLFFDLSNRSNIISLSLSISVLLLHGLLGKYMGGGASNRGIFAFSMIRRLFIFLPIVFVVLALVSDFNPFQLIEETGSDKIVSVDESGRVLVSDSRTSIYQDTYYHLMTEGGWLIGASAVVMPETSLMESDEGYQDGRLGGSESGILTLLMFGGVVYVLLFFMICFVSSSLAIYKSNNVLCKSIGVFIAMRWAVTFIESPLGLNFLWITHFVAIGMALSPEFRYLSDRQLQELAFANWEERN